MKKNKVNFLYLSLSLGIVFFLCANFAYAEEVNWREVAGNTSIEAADLQQIRDEIDAKRATAPCGNLPPFDWWVSGMPTMEQWLGMGAPVRAFHLNRTKVALVSAPFVWTPAQQVNILANIPDHVAGDLILSSDFTKLQDAVDQASCVVAACSCGWAEGACASGSCAATEHEENWVCAPANCDPPPQASPRCVSDVDCGGTCGGCSVAGTCGGGGCPSTHVPMDCPGCMPATDCQLTCDCACSAWSSGGPCGNDGCGANQRPRTRNCGVYGPSGSGQCNETDCWLDSSGCENCNNNGTCESGIGEDCTNCVSDCGCSGGLSCQSGCCSDCNGQCNGSASVDCTGTCGGSASTDCAGQCNGSATQDCEGTCNGSATTDCAGTCNGSATDDGCGCGNGPPICDDGFGTMICC